MNAPLCRNAEYTGQGRDWYDLVWYLGHHPQSRLRHSGDWTGAAPLTRPDLFDLLHNAIDKLNVNQARQEADRFVKDKSSLELWSSKFFLEIIERIDT